MSQRPLPITAVGVLGAIGALAAVVLLTTSSPWAVQPTTGQRAVGLAAVTAMTTGLVGMWRMRRWGVILIAVLFAGRIIYGVVRPGDWNVAALAGSVLLLLLGAVYWKRMT
jgi:hypothetical protein